MDKQQYNERRINNTDPRESCKVAKSILGITKNKTPTEILDDENKIETNPTKIADILNNYFIEKN